MGVKPASLAALAVFAVIILVVPALLITFWSPKHGRYGRHGRSSGFDECSVGLPSTAGGRHVPGQGLNDIDDDDDEEGGPGGEGARRSDRHRNRWRWWRSVKKHPASTLKRTLSQRRRVETVAPYPLRVRPDGVSPDVVNRPRLDHRRPPVGQTAASDYAQKSNISRNSHSWRSRRTRLGDPWSAGVPLQPLDLEPVEETPVHAHDSGAALALSHHLVVRQEAEVAHPNFEASPTATYNSGDRLLASTQVGCTDAGVKTYGAAQAAVSPEAQSPFSNPQLGPSGPPHHQARTPSPTQSFGQVTIVQQYEVRRHLPQPPHPALSTGAAPDSRTAETARSGDNVGSERTHRRRSSGKDLSFPMIKPGPWASRSPSNGTTATATSTHAVEAGQPAGGPTIGDHARRAASLGDPYGHPEATLAQKTLCATGHPTPFAVAAFKSASNDTGVRSCSEGGPLPAASVRPPPPTSPQQQPAVFAVPRPSAGLALRDWPASQTATPIVGAQKPLEGAPTPRPHAAPRVAARPGQAASPHAMRTPASSAFYGQTNEAAPTVGLHTSSAGSSSGTPSAPIFARMMGARTPSSGNLHQGLYDVMSSTQVEDSRTQPLSGSLTTRVMTTAQLQAQARH